MGFTNHIKISLYAENQKSHSFSLIRLLLIKTIN